jgi:hypothetical protein
VPSRGFPKFSELSPEQQAAIARQLDGEALAPRELVPAAPKGAAHGRRRQRRNEQNGLERDYQLRLEQLGLAGEVLWWAWEAATFRLADRTTYTPDFLVLLSTGELQAHECKGHPEDDYRVKVKVFAEQFPIAVLEVRRVDGGFQLEPV